MARKIRRIRHFFRRRSHRKSMTLVKGAKWVIALAPLVTQVYQDVKAGGISQLGVSLIDRTTGYNINDQRFNLRDALPTYLGFAAAYIFGKVASRVLR